ncbi:hypothetical protein NADFUDRAFT_70072 [Nadsonia fulvescens var. elongata DSM 6958]|uniref:Pentacotripeptide-repeat region of PRORP domain-containing protein n=1 Tax=Nadsonia fulvescens var. elongata DSM 6958 TaxID=857566 RepID=A0A1E3PJP4_9ASCO|nr:hypothetical protein NADFUDRAFT_70072 [Nadsonia fulvescens var. elongata DSM 6958]
MLDESIWFIANIINSRTWRSIPYVETESEARDRLNMMLYHAMHVGVDFITLKTAEGTKPKNKLDQLLDILELQGVKPDVKTYSIIFSNYKKRGMDKEALEVIQEIVGVDSSEHLFNGGSASILATDLLDLVSYHYPPSTVMDYYIQMFGTEYITKLGIAGLVYNKVIGSGEDAIADRLGNENSLPPIPSKLKNLQPNIMTLTILFQSVLAKSENRDSVYALWKRLIAVVKREQESDSFREQFETFQKPAFVKNRDIYNKMPSNNTQLIKLPRFQDHPTAGNILVYNFDFGIITAFIKCLCRLGERDLALGELEDVLATIKFNTMSSHPFTALIKAYSNDVVRCVHILELAAKYDIPPDISMLGGIINACERSGKTDEAAKWTVLANELGVNINPGSSALPSSIIPRNT